MAKLRSGFASSGTEFCFVFRTGLWCKSFPQKKFSCPRFQFFEIDPERHGKVTAFFIERKLLQLRRIGLKRAQLAEDPIADALLGNGQRPILNFTPRGKL
jgi:hypothetical protein